MASRANTAARGTAPASTKLTGKAIHPEAFRSSIVTVHAGARLRPTELLDRLVPQGFTRATQADQPGLVAVRGGTIDVWLERQGCAARIEFNAKSVERISLVGSDNKLEPATSVAITPPNMPAYARAGTGLSYLSERTTLLTTPALHAELGFRVNPGVHHVTWTAGADGFGQPVRLYHRRWNELKIDCDSIAADGWQVLALSSQADELKRLLAEHGISHITVAGLPESVRGLTGFRDEHNRIMVLTDFELLGSRHDVQERRRKLAKATAQALKEGDYVVHVDHGVARFAGLCEKQVDDAVRHYLQLDYAGGGKLYLPVEQADRITRYLGQAHPPLSKLDGGGAWAAALKKVKVEAGELARQILLGAARRQVHGGFALPDHPDEVKLAANFPYQPTPDQQQAVDEILADMRREAPMDRLLAGDVGFGKTEVAIRAAFKAVRGGKQVAVLCPTTVLATQHIDTFNGRLQEFGVRCAALTRFQTAAEQKKAVKGIRDGTVDIAIGTHRILSKDVQFGRLGLAIIDEEQKFGVKNKEQLKNLRTGCHVLALSATPIPRTLNMALSGLKDISTIETPPPGRLPIETNVLPYSDDVVKDAIERELERGGQVYFVSNKVARINLITEQLQKLVPQAKFDIGHGQMPENKLAEVMHHFDEGAVDVLVCSTIVENGLDLANVNTIIIENAPALGLAQAYQLRGRVGRGGKQAFAYFLYPSQKLVGQANERLKALLQHNALGSGFQIAMRDMELRGVGNALGKQQHGPAVSVGLHLYSRLLEETLLGMRDNRPPPDEQEVGVDLPLSAYIPAEAEPDQASRLRLYQQLANEDEAGLQRYADEVHARFVGMPLDPLDNLLEVLRLKLLCRAAGVAGVDSTVSRNFDGIETRWVRLKLGHDVAMGSVSQWIQAHPEWELRPKDDVVRVRQDVLGSQLLPKVREALRFLAG
jgi:transcription-repair coupling factor (superfamily II helicase)